jgi:serine phosphatase RsbU (regulator of sigma subunit)
MRDSVNNIETQKAAIKQQTKYEYDKQKAIIKKEHELQLTQKEDQAAADRQQQRIIIASISIILLLVMVFSGFLFNRFKLTQRQKNIIEAKEKETLLQKHIIEEKHKEITDSINYAERIQYSFLATKDFLDKHLQNYFVYFNPKDVVSGDFYWAGTLSNGNVALVTADSTGHGVPGAIMSLLNITSLENAIKETPEPGEILNITRQTIIDRLKKDGSAEGGKDGMDCSLIAFDFRNKKLVYAAANNPVWIVRNSEFIALPADRMPVGKHDKDAVPFTQHEVELKTGDVIYALTDGFPDQFGGPKGKKFKYKQLEELFLKIAQKPMKEQKEELDSVFQNWRGNLEQVDDVCIIGVRL